MSLFPSIFCTITVFSLYGEYAVRFPLLDGVFLPCDHGLDFDISSCKGIQSINQLFDVLALKLLMNLRRLNKSAIDLSNANTARGHRTGRKDNNGSHHSVNPLIKPTEIPIAAKFLPGPSTREHRKLMGAKTMPLFG